MPAKIWLSLLAVAIASFGFAQEPKPKDKPAESKKVEAKKEDPKASKGQLPANWKLLGLTDKQTKTVYDLQAKANEQMDKLEAEIKSLKEKLKKESLEVLTAEQKKRLEEILKEKSGTSDKPKP